MTPPHRMDAPDPLQTAANGRAALLRGCSNGRSTTAEVADKLVAAEFDISRPVARSTIDNLVRAEHLVTENRYDETSKKLNRLEMPF